jgi:hypothetical protein
MKQWQIRKAAIAFTLPDKGFCVKVFFSRNKQNGRLFAKRFYLFHIPFIRETSGMNCFAKWQNSERMKLFAKQ